MRCILVGRALLGLCALAPFALPALESAAADCDHPRRPSVGVNNVWYCDRDTDTVVVFVHGVLSDSRSAWYEESKGVYWPQLLLDDPDFPNVSVFLGGFHTSLDSSHYGMHDASDAIMKELREEHTGHRQVMKARSLVFVTHSTGGIVVRHLLNKNREAFAEKKVGLVLIASPSGGSRYATYLNSVTRLIAHRMAQELQWNHPFLDELDKTFSQLVKQQKLPGLMGMELVEHHMVLPTGTPQGFFASFLDALLKANLPQTVELSSAARYFDAETIPDSDHISIVKPQGVNALVHRRLRNFVKDLSAAAAPACQLPSEAGIRLAVDLPSELVQENELLPILVIQRDTSDERRSYCRENGRYNIRYGRPLPCPGDEYRAAFNLVRYSHLVNGGGEKPTKFCFARSRNLPNEFDAGILCTTAGGCVPDVEKPGMATACTTALRWPFSLIGVAHAAVVDGERHWSVPSAESLAALPVDSRPGFTELGVVSEQIAGLEGVTHYTYAVRVNGTPLYIDGWPGHSQRIEFSPSDGVRQAFALTNLAFTGGPEDGADGYEEIEVEFAFYAIDTLRTRVKTRRPYAAFRNYQEPWNDMMKAKTADKGARFVWRGRYVPSPRDERYEVMISSWKYDGPNSLAVALRGAALSRTLLDKKGETFDGHSVIGRVRPPRSDNRAFGVALGLAQPSGQVRSVFAIEEAKALCRWLVAHRLAFADAVSSDSYIYDFVPRNFTERGDRGRWLGTCKTLAQ